MDYIFAGDRQLHELSDSGANYCVVYPVFVDEFAGFSNRFVGFTHKKDAFEAALRQSERGTWAYLVELTDYHVIAYLTAWCAGR